MILNLVDQRSGSGAPLDAEEALLAALVAGLGLPQWTVNLALVEDDEMAALNARFHGGEGPTDVLSFSYLEVASGSTPELVGGLKGAAVDLCLPEDPGAAAAGEPPLAGEIVMAPFYIAQRCRQEGWDLRLEWAMLVVHGTLHILGWDHADAAQSRAMRTLEATALAQAGLPHPLLPEAEAS
jgi:probable rRNA maturation factor